MIQTFICMAYRTRDLSLLTNNTQDIKFVRSNGISVSVWLCIFVHVCTDGVHVGKKKKEKKIRNTATPDRLPMMHVLGVGVS